jgi:hypothetical protein
MRTFFKKRPPWYGGESNSPPYHGGRFLKKVLILEKKWGADFFPGFVWWVVYIEGPKEDTGKVLKF